MLEYQQIVKTTILITRRMQKNNNHNVEKERFK